MKRSKVQKNFRKGSKVRYTGKGIAYDFGRGRRHVHPPFSMLILSGWLEIEHGTEGVVIGRQWKNDPEVFNVKFGNVVKLCTPIHRDELERV